MDVHVITVLYWNNSVHDVELLWTHRQVIMIVLMY